MRNILKVKMIVILGEISKGAANIKDRHARCYFKGLQPGIFV